MRFGVCSSILIITIGRETENSRHYPALCQAYGVLATTWMEETAYRIIPYLYFWPAWPGDANPNVDTRPCLETANPMFVPTALPAWWPPIPLFVLYILRPYLVITTVNPMFAPTAVITYPSLYVAIFIFIVRGFVFSFIFVRILLQLWHKYHTNVYVYNKDVLWSRHTL